MRDTGATPFIAPSPSVRRCKTCQEIIPDEKFACPACVAAKSLSAYAQYQYHFGATIAADKAELTIVYIPGGEGDRAPLWHLQRFEDIRHAYCGRELKAGRQQDHLTYSQLMRQVPKFCPLCAEELDRVVHAVPAH